MATDQAPGTSTEYRVPGAEWLTTFSALGTRYFVVILLGLVAVPHLVTLLSTPAPYQDDGWYASRAWAVLHTGYAYGPLDKGPFDELPGHEHYMWLLGSWIQAPFVWIFGTNLFAVRIVSLLFGLGLLAIIYAIATKLFDRRVGFIALVVGAFSPAFIRSAHIGRQDIMVAVFAYGAILLYLRQESPRLTWGSFFTGLLLGLTPDIHFTGVIFVPVIAVLLLYDYRLGLFKAGRTWGMVLGFLCGIAYFVAIHILPNPQTYFAIYGMQQSSITTTPPITVLDPAAWGGSLARAAFLPGLFTLLLSILAILVLLLKPARNNIRLVLLAITLLVGFAAVVSQDPPYYAILLAPSAWLMIAAAAGQILPSWHDWRTARWSPLRVGLVLGGIAILVVSSLSLLTDNHTDDYNSALNVVRQTVPPGKSIIGQETYWLARPDDPYYAWEQIIYHRRFKPGSNLNDSLGYLRPDYIILDTLTDSFLLDNPIPAYQNVAVSPGEMASFLAQHSTLVARQDNPTYGDIRIYKINQ